MVELRLTKDGSCFVPLARRGVKQINVEMVSQVITPMYVAIERVGTYDVVIKLRPVKQPKKRRRTRIVGVVKKPFRRRRKRQSWTDKDDVECGVCQWEGKGGETFLRSLDDKTLCCPHCGSDKIRRRKNG